MDNSLWMVSCGAGMLLMRVGFALHTGGMMRSKNSAGAALRGLVDASVAALAFWAIGGAIAGAQPGQWMDWKLAFRIGESQQGPELFMTLCAMLIAPAIVVGAVGERSKFFPMLIAPVILGAVVVPVGFRWAGGWLAGLGYHDLAGAGAIQLAGALCALAAVVLVGPRMGKYNRDGSSNGIPGHSVPLASVGMMLVLVAWVPYVMGFTGTLGAGTAAMNVLLAGAAGTVAAVLYSQWKYSKPDIHLALSGMLGALVAISASGDSGQGLSAVVIGAVAGVLVPMATIRLDLVWKIDDPAGGIGAHGVGAIVGILAAGIVMPTPTLLDKLTLLAMQLLGLIVIGGLALAVSTGVLLAMKQAVGLRSREADEFDGLDLAEHDVGAYPDFQQTMIKSYHLREA